jgi:hypothetical protein
MRCSRRVSKEKFCCQYEYIENLVYPTRMFLCWCLDERVLANPLDYVAVTGSLSTIYLIFLESKTIIPEVYMSGLASALFK